MKQEIRERLLAKCEPVPECGCWIWTACSNKTGYGFLRVGRKSLLAHRLSYEAFNGPIPEGQHVCHRCDTRACINPAHLFAGSNLDNIQDSMRKGRRKGVPRRMPAWRADRKVWQRKIPLVDHAKIRSLYSSGMNGVQIAELFGVGSTIIYKILAAA